MPRLPALSWLLALAVGVALAAPAGCHAQSEARELPAESPTTTVSTASPAQPDTTDTLADTTDERRALPDGFVRLRDVAREIAHEIRYTTAYNFVGEPIDGYLAPECILTEPAADALAGVARDLARDGLGLKVYDCYRPQTAVNHFVRWANTPSALGMRDAFYPTEPKGRLFSRGYIATRSGHSRGSTVDLTLVRLPAEDAVRTSYPDSTETLPRCDRPLSGADGRLAEGDLDMGTAYDCLSPSAATASRAVSAEARRNRERLRAAMSARGFRNYTKEWWHFTLRDEPHARTYFDFPVD